MKQRGQAVFDKILDTAERLFYVQGYCNTGINQVIEEADIAKASLYKHFSTKTDLLVAYIERTHQRWFNRLKEAIDQTQDPKEKLLVLFDYHLERQEIRQFGGCPFIKAHDEAGTNAPRVIEEIRKAKQHSQDIIKELVSKATHRQLLTDEQLAETIYLTLEGAIITASVFKQPAHLQSARKIIQQLI